MTDDEPIRLTSTSVAQEDAPPDPDGFDFDAFERAIVPLGVPHDPYYVIPKGNPDGTDKIVPYKPAIRDIAKVTGICLHQTACVMGESPARYRRMSVHFVVTLGGVCIQMCDVLALLYGGDLWNAGCVHIETDGAYAGLEDDPSTLAKREDVETFWANGPVKAPMQVTPAAMRTLRNLERYIIELVRRRGGGIRVIVAHRQASASRPSCPGQAIWQHGAVPILEEYGLSDGGPGFKLGGGRALPDAWTGQANGIRY